MASLNTFETQTVPKQSGFLIKDQVLLSYLFRRYGSHKGRIYMYEKILLQQGHKIFLLMVNNNWLRVTFVW